MDESYRRLAAEVAAAGGRLELEPGALPSRLEMPVDLRDAYVRYSLSRRLAEVGVTAEFQGDGRVSLVGETVPEAPAPRPATVPPAPPDTPTETAPIETAPTAQQVGDWAYAVLMFACTFLPAAAYDVAPGGKLGDKQEAFFTIYFATLPLSLAATFIFLTFGLGWFDNFQQRIGAAGAAIVVSAVFGIGFAQSYADLQAISELQGPAGAVAGGIVALALGSYAIYYGMPLYIAGWVTGLIAALWIKEKAGHHLG